VPDRLRRRAVPDVAAVAPEHPSRVLRAQSSSRKRWWRICSPGPPLPGCGLLVPRRRLPPPILRPSRVPRSNVPPTLCPRLGTRDLPLRARTLCGPEGEEPRAKQGPRHYVAWHSPPTVIGRLSGHSHPTRAMRPARSVGFVRDLALT